MYLLYKIYQSWDNFALSKKGYNGYSGACKNCVKIRALIRKYDMNIDQYNAMVNTQNGQCAICGQNNSKLVIDHNHVNGNVRGLLCDTCNLALGLLQDDPSILRSAAEYLESYT